MSWPTRLRSAPRPPRGSGDEQALDHHLRDEAPARGAHGDTHRDLALAGPGSGEHQGGQVAAGNQQDQPRQAQEQRQRRAVRLAQPAHAAAGGNCAESKRIGSARAESALYPWG